MVFDVNEIMMRKFWFPTQIEAKDPNYWMQQKIRWFECKKSWQVSVWIWCMYESTVESKWSFWGKADDPKVDDPI